MSQFDGLIAVTDSLILMAQVQQRASTLIKNARLQGRDISREEVDDLFSAIEAKRAEWDDLAPE